MTQSFPKLSRTADPTAVAQPEDISPRMFEDAIRQVDASPRGSAVPQVHRDVSGLAAVRAMVTAHGNLDAIDNNGMTAAHRAARDGDTVALEALCRHGADMKLSDANGNTPLHYARSAADIIIMLEYGADPSAINNAGQRPGDRVAESLRLGLWLAAKAQASGVALASAEKITSRTLRP